MPPCSSRSRLASTALFLLATGLLCATASHASDDHHGLRGRTLLQKKSPPPPKSPPSPPAKLVFPPLCNCERNPRKSPFRLSLDGSTSGSEPGLKQFCFKVENVGGCDPTLKCCDGTQAASKVEFDVVTTCKDSMKKVTVNGKQQSYEYNTKLSVLRITNLNTTAATSAGTQICLYLAATSACPSLAQLCTAGSGQCKYALFNQDRDCCPVGITTPPPPPPSPTPSPSSPPPVAPSPPPPSPPPPSPPPPSPMPSPPPPFVPSVIRHPPPSPSPLPPPASPPSPPAPPPSDFPYCQCQRSAYGSRLFTAVSNNVTIVNNLTRICFTVGLKDVCQNPKSKCCEFNLYKMEFEVDAACSNALAYTSVDGAQRVRFFQTSPTPAIKVVNLDKPVSAVNGTEVCLFLKPSCNTLKALCARHDGSCAIALFNKPGTGSANCCPLSTVRL